MFRGAKQIRNGLKLIKFARMFVLDARVVSVLNKPVLDDTRVVLILNIIARGSFPQGSTRQNHMLPGYR